MNSTVLFLAGFLVYTAILILAGWLYGKKKSEGSNFLTGGRGITVFMLMGTIVATSIGTGNTVGATGNGFAYGWAGVLVALGNGIGLICMLPFVRLRKFNLLTIVDEAQFLLGENRHIRRLFALLVFVMDMVMIGGAINGAAKYLCYITDIPEVWGKALLAVAFLGFTVFGGYLSVAFTDTIQAIVFFLGFALVAFKAAQYAGGYSAAVEAFEQTNNSGALSFLGIKSYGLMATITLIVTSFYNITGAGCLHSRVFTSASTKAAKRGFIIGGIATIIFGLLPSIIGIHTLAITVQEGITIANKDDVFAFVSMYVLGPTAGLLFLIAGLSAALSSADSILMSAVTVAIRDIFPMTTGHNVPEDKSKLYSRIAVIAGTVGAFLLSLFAKDVVGYLVNVAGSIYPGSAVVLYIACFWKRSTWQGGYAGIIGCLVFAVLYLGVAPFNAFISGTLGGPPIAATIVTAVCMIVVSLCTKKQALTDDERLRLIDSF